MKAIQIKYMGCTDTRPSRLKAEVMDMEASYVEQIDHEIDISEQAKRMAERVILNLHWDNVKVSGFGVLPNGDYVATLGSI